jgi:p-aminobenzoyl-glutamate transporter AbgT
VAGKRTRKADYDYFLGFKTREIIGSAFNNVCKYGALVAVFYFIRLMVGDLAGKETLASVALGFLADVKTSKGVAMLIMAIFGISGSAYGIRQRKLRRDDIQLRSGQISELERSFDRKRSSSGLTPRGTTRKEDQ